MAPATSAPSPRPVPWSGSTTRTASRPASSSRPPNAIRYAFTTQASPDWEKPRAYWIEGSATFTMVWSRITMRTATHSTISASQRRRSRTAAGDVLDRVIPGRLHATTSISQALDDQAMDPGHVGWDDTWPRLTLRPGDADDAAHVRASPPRRRAHGPRLGRGDDLAALGEPRARARRRPALPVGPLRLPPPAGSARPPGRERGRLLAADPSGHAPPRRPPRPRARAAGHRARDARAAPR